MLHRLPHAFSLSTQLHYLPTLNQSCLRPLTRPHPRVHERISTSTRFCLTTAAAIFLSVAPSLVVVSVVPSNKTSTLYSRPREWTEVSADFSVAVAHVRLLIKDFSFMSVTEVDPVNYATVIGAAGGAWRKFLFRTTAQTLNAASETTVGIRHKTVFVMFGVFVFYGNCT